MKCPFPKAVMWVGEAKALPPLVTSFLSALHLLADYDINHWEGIFLHSKDLLHPQADLWDFTHGKLWWSGLEEAGRGMGQISHLDWNSLDSCPSDRPLRLWAVLIQRTAIFTWARTKQNHLPVHFTGWQVYSFLKYISHERQGDSSGLLDLLLTLTDPNGSH